MGRWRRAGAMVLTAAAIGVSASWTPAAGARAHRLPDTCSTYYNWTETDIFRYDPFHTTYTVDAEDLEPGGEWEPFGEINSVEVYVADHPTSMVSAYTLASQEHWQNQDCTSSGQGR